MIKAIFRDAMVGTALAGAAGAVFAVAEPEITGAAISSGGNAFNQGYAMEMGTEPLDDNQTAKDGLNSKSVMFIVGKKYAQFQRGLENPENLPDLIEESRFFSSPPNEGHLASNIEQQFKEAGLYEASLTANIKEQFESEGLYENNTIVTPPSQKPF